MKELWVLIGILSLVLGLIGIVLPILPTTPFLILTAYGFSKGNKRFHNWYMNNKLLQKFSLKMEMTMIKKVVINIIVDIMILTYIIIYRNVLLTVVLVAVITVKHFIFFKYVKTI